MSLKSFFCFVCLILNIDWQYKMLSMMFLCCLLLLGNLLRKNEKNPFSVLFFLMILQYINENIKKRKENCRFLARFLLMITWIFCESWCQFSLGKKMKHWQFFCWFLREFKMSFKTFWWLFWNRFVKVSLFEKILVGNS